MFTETSILVAKPGVGLVAKLVQVRNAGKVDHWWRATHEDHCVWAGWRQVAFDHLIVDETGAVLPTWSQGIMCFMNIYVYVFKVFL